MKILNITLNGNIFQFLFFSDLITSLIFLYSLLLEQ